MEQGEDNADPIEINSVFKAFYYKLYQSENKGSKEETEICLINIELPTLLDDETKSLEKA